MALPAGRVPNGLFGTVLVIGAESTLFCGLLAAWVVLRSQYSNWPPLGQPRLPVAATAFNTGVLIASALVLEHAWARRQHRRLRWTLALGGAFLLLQGREWLALARHGLAMDQSPYAALFTTILAAHALHVGAGLVAVGLALRGDRADFSATRAWWWFVVGLWPVIYALVYLW